jgi:paraquat-inducible protein B
MDQGPQNPIESEGLPVGRVQGKNRLSIVWFVPIAALLMGSWLVYKAVSEKGPEVAIYFNSAEGLEAGKTKIKYKNVDVGVVEHVNLNNELSEVVLRARFKKEMAPFLTDRTRFWVVRARIAASEVSGLSTLFSGAYIGMDPVRDGKEAQTFQGLESPPVVALDTPGRFFNLESEHLGSLGVGSAVYFRRIKVGHVVSYALGPDGKTVNIRIFVQAPHHERVYQNTRFWNASGLDVAVDPTGIRINTESFVTLMVGGISFATFDPVHSVPRAEEDASFTLYTSREKIEEFAYTERTYFLLRFRENIRGLSVGASVELRGNRIGEVTNVRLEFFEEDLTFDTLVIIAIDPERIVAKGRRTGTSTGEELVQTLVRKGLRAQLKTGVLLTGKLYVNFDMFPNEPLQSIRTTDTYMELPTIPGTMEQATDLIFSLMDRLEKVPFDELVDEITATIRQVHQVIGAKEVQESIVALKQVLDEMVTFSRKLNDEVATGIVETLDQTKQTLAVTEQLVAAESPLGYELARLLKELSQAAQSIHEMADYLEKHPDSLIYGKGADQ